MIFETGWRRKTAGSMAFYLPNMARLLTAGSPYPLKLPLVTPVLEA